jgi:hypothetical protein
MSSFTWLITIKGNTEIEVAVTDFVLALIESGKAVSVRRVKKESPA